MSIHHRYAIYHCCLCYLERVDRAKEAALRCKSLDGEDKDDQSHQSQEDEDQDDEIQESQDDQDDKDDQNGEIRDQDNLSMEKSQLERLFGIPPNRKDHCQFSSQ